MKYKLIVADRSPSVQKVIQLAFPESEFEMFPFEDGTEIMKNLGKIQPDAILLSLSLPGKDVYEIGFYLKNQEEFRNTSIFFLKGAFEPIDQHKIAAMDYDEIVRKPFDSEKLAKTVKEVIERRRKPFTLPEEPGLDETVSEETEAGKGEQILHEEIHDAVSQKISRIEKDIEERVKKKVFHELKELLRNEIGGINQKVSELASKNKK